MPCYPCTRCGGCDFGKTQAIDVSVCPNCGAPVQGEETRCLDCGALLPPPLPPLEITVSNADDVIEALDNTEELSPFNVAQREVHEEAPELAEAPWPEELDALALEGAKGESAEGTTNQTSVDEIVRQSVREQQLGKAAGEQDNTLLRAAGATAVAVALATTLTTAPIDEAKAQLPEPVPIVQVYAPPTPDLPPNSPDDEADDQESAKQKIIKLLKAALIAILFAGACLVGASQAGCTACSGMLGIPLLGGGDSAQQSTQQANA